MRSCRGEDRDAFGFADARSAIATIILEELENEMKWSQSFANSHDVLAKLAAEAMAEYRAGETEKLDPETL